MINTFTIKSAVLGIGLLAATATFAQKDKKKSDKNKFLEGKKYDVQFYDVKTTGRGKATPSDVTIKSGQVQSELMTEKLTVPPIAYKVTVDSNYVEDDDSIHMVTFKCDFVEDKNEYKWEATVKNYSIEGTCISLKSGVEKKRFEFEGEEKAKKK